MGSTYRKGLLLSLGSVIQTQVDLVTVIPSGSNKPGMNRLCPEHKQKLTQAHHCDAGEGHYVTEFILGKDTGNGFLIPEGERPETPASDVLQLTPVPASELADHAIPGASRFYLVPTNAALIEPWQVIYNLVSKGKLALVAKGSLRRGSYEKLWQVEVFREALVLTEIIYPDTINDPPPVTQTKVQKQITNLVDEFVAGLLSSWDQVDKTNTGRQRLDDWLATAPDADIVQVNDSNVGAAQSMIEALRAAVEEKTA